MHCDQILAGGATVTSETHLVVVDLGIPDPSKPDSVRSTVTSEKYRLIGLDTSNDRLLERLGRCIDVCAWGRRSARRLSTMNKHEAPTHIE